MKDVVIVLATYNGAAYLDSLLDSVRRQSCTDWTLLARDDGSSDATPAMLSEAAAKDRRVVIVEDDLGRRGPARNFGLLIEQAFDREARYVFFADQDDVWLPDKMERQLDLMRRAEAERGADLPHLVYSDLTVIDEEGRTVHPSFFRLARLRHGQGRPLGTLLGRSFVLGCAAMVNRPLLELALPMPDEVASHDWWMALCAAAAGWISELPGPTLRYRRHGGNTSGPAGFWAGFNPLRHPLRQRWRTGLASFQRSVAQAAALRQRLAERLPGQGNEESALLGRFCEAFDRPGSRLRRAATLWRLGLPAIDWPRRLLYYLCMLADSER
jgi:rhamnosyltransferase